MISDKGKLTITELGATEDDAFAHASQSILLVPLNWESSDTEPVYAVSTESVLKLFAQQGIPSQTLSPLTAETKLKDERAMDWVAPTLFVSSLLLSQNPMAVSLALNVMGNYATELFKGLKKDPIVKLTIVHMHERGKTSRKIHYEGVASGLPSLVEILSSFEPKE
jgi:hypothetical protein